ncbi:hypothetical protein F5Y18DRAFT_181279 [Xylariaceae sp. FL1019]|nr:hypothetical protein F5Y18DRAFT_181279 [Xylariaceae sp. FL1019]
MGYLYPSCEKGLQSALTFRATKCNSLDKFEFIHELGVREHDALSLDKLPDDQKLNLQRLLNDAAEAGSGDCIKLLVDKYTLF